jgi:hypothetical protein
MTPTTLTQYVAAEHAADLHRAAGRRRRAAGPDAAEHDVLGPSRLRTALAAPARAARRQIGLAPRP